MHGCVSDSFIHWHNLWRTFRCLTPLSSYWNENSWFQQSVFAFRNFGFLFFLNKFWRVLYKYGVNWKLRNVSIKVILITMKLTKNKAIHLIMNATRAVWSNILLIKVAFSFRQIDVLWVDFKGWKVIGKLLNIKIKYNQTVYGKVRFKLSYTFNKWIFRWIS